MVVVMRGSVSSNGTGNEWKSCSLWCLLMPLDSSRNIGPQRHSSNALGFGSSSSVRPTTFR